MKNILIIGAGEFGKHLAKELVELKNEVRIVDANDAVINALSDDFRDSLIGDCRNINVVKELGVENYDICVVAVGGNFQASLEITSNLRDEGAKYIISQCQSETQTKFLEMAGADKTVYAQKEAAEKIAFICNGDNLVDYISISDDYKIVKITIPKMWVGHKLPELDIRKVYNLNILAVENGDKVFIPSIDYVFRDDDMLLILGEEKQLSKLPRA